MKKEKIYFASDFHLGSPNLKESHKKEKIIIQWLEEIKDSAKSIYLVGDVFDFWFEYNKVVPKGFVRILGKLAELIDNGTEIHFFTGNHDMWTKDYLNKEIGIILHNECKILNIQKKKIFIGHGDGLGNGDYFYKILRIIFKSNISRWLFSIIHPDIGIKIAQIWSRKSRNNKKKNNTDISVEKEILIDFCKKQQEIKPVDYYIFGHRHIPLDFNINEKTKYINTGDWISHYSYAEMYKGIINLKKYK